MQITEVLESLMNRGYDIYFECKSKDRSFPMTYEGYAKRTKNTSLLQPQCHAVGNTFEEFVFNLRNEIDNAENVNSKYKQLSLF